MGLSKGYTKLQSPQALCPRLLGREERSEPRLERDSLDKEAV